MASYFEPDNPNVAMAAGVAINGTANVPIVRPNLATPVNALTAAGAWTFGAWVQLTAAADLTSHAMIWLAAHITGTQDWYQIQFGTGGAGAEVVAANFSSLFDTAVGENRIPLIFCCVPMIKVPAGARTAVRIASNGGGAAALNIWASFIPVPLA